MKSAYELAMERLEAESGPSKKLTEEQKTAIAEIDAKINAQVAETKMKFDERLAGAPYQEIAGIQEELGNELRKLEDRRESDKEKVWSA